MNDFEQLIKRVNDYKNDLIEKVEHKKKDILSQLDSLEGIKSKKFKKVIKSTNDLFKKIEIENKYILEIEKKNILLDQIRKNKFQKSNRNIWKPNFDNIKCIKTVEYSGYFCLKVIDKNTIAFGYNNTIKISNLNNSSYVNTLLANNHYVKCLEFIDTNIIASGGGDSTIKIWNLNESPCIKTLEGHLSWVFCFKLIDKNTIASGSDDHTIKIWNLNELRCL